MRTKVRMLALLAALTALAAAPPARPGDPYHLKPGARGALCVSCHSDFQDTMKLPFVHTPVKSGDCAGCHDPHDSSHGKLLAAEPGAICAGCHPGIAPETSRSVHPPVAARQCLLCHDPHGSKNKANLVAAGDALCASCHAAVAKGVSSAKFKHPPAARSCLACHDPHASSKSEFLLKKEVPSLCADCHRTDQPQFAKQHMNYPVAKARCTSCHDPHGSDNSGILWATIHPPVMNKMCGQCHQEPGSRDPLGLKKTGFELCRGCHSALVNEALSKNRLHWPAFDSIGCRNCHNPHASPNAKLLREPPKILCGACHADTLARQEKSPTKHKPIDEGSCVACHSPHASDNLYLLNGPNVVAVCGSCHNWKQHSSHPIGEKVNDPRNRNLSLDCLSCHRAHGTAFKSFTTFDPASELCVQCHSSVKR